MYSSLTDIVELHDQILGSLHRAVPNSEYVGIPPMSTSRSSSPSKIQRRRSLDVVPEDRTKGLPLYEHSGLSAGPQTAAAVANIFTKIVRIIGLSFPVTNSLWQKLTLHTEKPTICIRRVRRKVRNGDE